MAIDFDDIAKTIGYVSARSMFEDMYVTKDMSLLDIADILGVNRNTVTRQVRLAGIQVHTRGGSHPIGAQPNKLLESIPMSRLIRAKISRLAGQLDLAPSTIYEYLRRKGIRRPGTQGGRGPKHNPHPGYSRKKGAHTPRPDNVDQAAETVLNALTDGQLEAVLEEQENEGHTEGRGDRSEGTRPDTGTGD